ncbi:MAG: KH domain-containing protein [Clostridia bacterium]|nr:KH domain-containing protein [Clostridia bacterium]
MIKEAVGTGGTLDEAKENALIALGAAPEADVHFETLELPKKKVLGMFGGALAKVRVYTEVPDEEKKAQPKTVKTNQKKKPEKKKTEKQSVENKPAKSDVSEYGESVDESTVAPDTSAGKAIKYLRTILSNLGCENVSIKVAEKEGGALISLEGDGLGVIIGRRGETLEALQVLVSLAANNGGGYYRVSLNIGDYREKREQTLTSLAGRIAKQVQSTGRNRVLEPMSPYERRIIHTAVQEIKGVESNSIGEGENRRVVIHPEGKRVDERSGRGPRSRGGRDRRTSNTVSSVPTREPMKDSDIPLYGKIGK